MDTNYTLKYISQNPLLVTYAVDWNELNMVLRPLVAKDTEKLANFLSKLSPDTQKNYVLDDYGYKTAEEFCSTIAIYDKLRLVLDYEGNIVGLFEYSMDIPENDSQRFEGYGVYLNYKQTCRFGPCIDDEFQGQGLASAVLPHIFNIAKKMGRTKMYLWGGVFSDNENAIKFYSKNGFAEIGSFINQDGRECHDMIIDL